MSVHDFTLAAFARASTEQAQKVLDGEGLTTVLIHHACEHHDS